MADDDIELLQQLIMHRGAQAFSLIPAALKKVVVEKQWRDRKDKHGKLFLSFEAFITHPLWQGLESSIADLRVYCRKQPDIERLILAEIEPGATLAEAGAKGGRGKKASSNTTGFVDRGATYLLKRLKRDRPDLFQQVLDGVMSANAAAIKAGFKKKLTPLERMLKDLSKLTPTEWRQLRARGDERFKPRGRVA